MVWSSYFSGHSSSPGSSSVDAPNQCSGSSIEFGPGETLPGLTSPNSSTSCFLEAELSYKLNDHDFSKPLLKYIDQVLMEESPDERFCQSHDPCALRATEKSLYDVITPNKMLSANNTLRGNYRHPVPSCSQQSGSWPSSRSSLITFTSSADDNLVGTSANIHGKLPGSSKGRKNHLREDIDRYLKQERINKQVAVSTQEDDLSEMFDRLLLSQDYEEIHPDPYGDDQGGSGAARRSRGSQARAKTRDKKDDHHAVDLRNLLVLCAKAVSAGDYRTANELLSQIRQHSSPTGDGVQRLAHYFAKGLEARMSGYVIRNPYVHCKVPIADMLRFYQTVVRECPFAKILFSYANNMITKVAEKAKILHVVDFGILYGFQWPLLIQFLSRRQGGPPMLRVTGIDIPLQGFKPLERIEEAGAQLARCCERLGVPFEYRAIASRNWETIKISELKLKRNEVLAVNCLFRFRNLLDETLSDNSPRDTVLQLIRDMRPDMFVHSVVNGSYNSPFFMTRFKEALYHFSVVFEMIDASVPRDSTERMLIEGEYFGWELMNVISCEGSDRFERPETYKRWQSRITQAGFQQLPLEQKLLQIYQTKLKQLPDKDFMVGEDNKWLIQGYKGRIVYASACWKPDSRS